MNKTDEMNLARDGQLFAGKSPSGLGVIRGVFEFRRKLPNGHTITSDGRDGEIEWTPTGCECDDCQGRFVCQIDEETP